MTEFYWTKLFLAFLGIKIVFQHYLSFRNQKYVLKHRAQVPTKFQDKLGLEEHQKAADYTVAKAKFGRTNLIIETIFLLIWTLGGGLKYLYHLTSSFNFSPFWSQVILIFSYIFINILIGIPEGLYSTFVIEEKFGFNKTTLKTFFSDFLKQIILILTFGMALISAIVYIMDNLGNNWWLYAWVTFSLFQLCILLIYPTFIAPLFNKFTPLEEGELKNQILKLLDKLGFSCKGLFVMDASKRSSHGNAYFTGFGKNKRIVFFDTLIKSLTPLEVEAVLAHELGHFKKKHVLKSMILSFLFSLVGLYFLGILKEKIWFYQGLGNIPPSTATALILFSIVAPILTFFATPVLSWHSRKNEFEADEFAALHSEASNLISALVKMYRDNASTLTPDPVFSSFYFSHPPALQRISFLEGLMKKH